MKVLIVLAAVAVSCVSAGSFHGYGAPGLSIAAPLGAPLPAPLAIASTGSSQQFRAEDNYGNYQFGYDESHSTGSSSRREDRSGDVVRGQYNLADADGRRRTVNYVADASGFHASVQTNEPGVDPERDPADVLVNKAGIAVAAPAPLQLASPLPAPAPIGAPAPLPAAPVFRAPILAAPLPQAPLAGPVFEGAPVLLEEQTPRAFSYSFGNSHPNFLSAPALIALPASAPAPAPLPLPLPLPAPAPLAFPAPAPIIQQGIKY